MNEYLPEATSDILMYQTEDGQTKIDVRLEDGTVWLPQAALAELFQVTKQNISLHLKNIFAEGELNEKATVKEYLTVQIEGRRQVNRDVKHYNLDAIIAVGYRVRSHRGTQFRRWATERLKEYLVKGFVMDDERLKNIGTPFGADYFDELLERIRDIRASEKRFYRKITDIYATAVDYDSRSEPAQTFFQTVQNKLHWAVTGHTAAELIAERADAKKPNMGLTSWKGAKVRKPDVAVAKNYMTAEELNGLNRIVTMYLDYAEDQARRKRPMNMADWASKLDAFLSFNERDVLDHAGHVRAEVAKQLAQTEYDKFHARRLEEEAQEEDAFERVVKRIEKKGHGE
ncbi:hypothetical protein Pcar_1093 [Syntrophotalea carbinolica DSM 2380]|uniref:Hydroxyacid dehydrogenase n=1 Tax=Syntrophotalea carbinolica (strain DSM 2380 / NBRC 103641 / GraBd1) TaxID=338963 RepID=Q3A5L5_SYNC1|nr:virulence RhuM family protein [Syntrophotalea carbinolica]ABA88342.1 hypothetical protein Pcar_1093 [Syntrophotalea carbinolica DSM 2380]